MRLVKASIGKKMGSDSVETYHAVKTVSFAPIADIQC